MDLFRRMKSRISTSNLSKHQKKQSASNEYNGHGHHQHYSDAFSNSNSSRRTDSYDSTYSASRAPITQLPSEILTRIFAYICPHGTDDNYLSSEDSLAGNGCPLCNTRDLAQASQVCRRWREAAQTLLYTNVRLEQVHYCDLEEELWRRRNRKSFFSNGNTDSNEPVKTRMRLLYRTIQENESIANSVLYLKAPFWVREGCKQELTLLVSLLPNLRYVDLPQAVYIADNSCPLLATMRSRCSQIRVMGWRGGAENSFIHSAMDQPWRMLEIITLTGMKIDDLQLQSVLHSLPHLQSIKLEQMTYLTDTLFDASADSMGFPQVKTLIIEECPNLTITGLTKYLQLQAMNPTLEELTLTNTGFIPDQLNIILSMTPVLRKLSIAAAVQRQCQPVSQIQYLTSTSLQEITYDITNSDATKGLTLGAPSYYTYLADSLCAGTLPNMKKMYVNEARFSQRLKGTYTTPHHTRPHTRGGSESAATTASSPMQMPMPNSAFLTPPSLSPMPTPLPTPSLLTPQHTTKSQQGYFDLMRAQKPWDQKVDVYCKGHTEMTWKWYVWTCTSNTNSNSANYTGLLSTSAPGSPAPISMGRFGGMGEKTMAVIDMEPEKQWTSSRGFLTIPGARDEQKEKELTKKDKKRDKRKSLNDTYGMGAEYY